MDKTIKGDGKNEHPPEVHKIPPGELAFHRDYGLRISLLIRGNKAIPCGKIVPRYFQFYCISHMYDGKGVYWDRERGESDILPGDMICITPGHVHFYGGNGDFYIEDSVCFYGPVADFLCRSKVFSNRIIRYGANRVLLPIIELAQEPGEESQLRANIALQNFICELYFIYRAKFIGYERFSSLVNEIKKFPSKWWSVREMAEFCNMSEVNFRRVFKRHFGISPKDYLTRAKIAMAAEELCSGDLPVFKVSKMFGFADPFHFSRRFKNCMGISPLSYRKKMRGGSFYSIIFNDTFCS